MAFSITPVRAGAPAVVVATIVPQIRVLGDYWTFVVDYTNPDGSAANLTGLIPKAELLPGYGQPPIALTAISTVGNEVTFGFGDSTSLVPQTNDAGTFPVRLHAYVTDSFNRITTYVIQPVVPVSPKTTDLAKLPPQRTIVGVAGPAGPQGVPGIAADQAQIDAAIAGAIQSQIPLLKGDKGDKGDIGLQGPPGLQGLQGIKGDPGVKGDQGLQGTQGLQGQQGIQGLPGVKGDTGLAGLKGDQGIQGLQGLQGIKGDTGTPGLRGPDGPQGPQGPQGLPGTKGDAGAIGLILGSGAPSSAPTVNNQGYLDTASRAFYVSGNGVWTLFGYLAASPSGVDTSLDYAGALILDMSVPGALWIQ